MLAEDLKITVNSDGSVTLYEQSSNTTTEFSASEGICTVQAKNYCGYELPSTGGPGTTLIYLLGALMLLISGSCMVLYRRRRIRSDASSE